MSDGVPLSDPGPHAHRVMKATNQQMRDAGLALANRDYCAHILIPLNECRRRTIFTSSAECAHLNHEYEICQHDLWLDRVRYKYERQRKEGKIAPQKGYQWEVPATLSAPPKPPVAEE